MLVDPAVVARFSAVLADALEAGTRILIERPALRTVVAGRLRAVERGLALAAVEAADVAARERHPHDALAVDVAAARAEARHRDVEHLGQLRVGIVTHHAAASRKHPDGIPDRAIGRIRHDRVGAGAAGDAHILGGIYRLIGLGVLVSLAVAVDVEDERRPALRLGGVAGLVEDLHVDPPGDPTGTAGPGPVLGIELQVMRSETGIDEGVLHRLRIQDRHLADVLLDREGLRRWMVGALLAEVRIVGAADRGGEPDPSLAVEHRVVIVDPAVPDLLLAPVGRRRDRLLDRGMTRAEGFRHLRILHRRPEVGDRVGLGIEDGQHVGRVFGRAEELAVGVHGRVAPVR